MYRLGSTGKLLLNSSGKIATSCEGVCTFCDPKPTAWDLSYTGITLCTDDDFTVDAIVDSSFQAEPAVLLEDSCLWRKYTRGPQGDPPEYPPDQSGWILATDGGTDELALFGVAYETDDPTDTTAWVGGHYFVHRREPGSCSAMTSVSNDNDGTACFGLSPFPWFDTVLATGGTGTATPVLPP